MSAPKTTAGIKVPPFTRDDFGLWKMKMLLFIKASNPLYIGILENGPFVPMKPVSESTAPMVAGFLKAPNLRISLSIQILTKN